MKKMAAILAVLMAAVMVMGMTASAEAYEKEPIKWLSASEAVTIRNSSAAIGEHLQKNQVSIGFLGCDDSAANNNQTGRFDIRNLFDVLASGQVISW